MIAGAADSEQFGSMTREADADYSHRTLGLEKHSKKSREVRVQRMRTFCTPAKNGLEEA